MNYRFTAAVVFMLGVLLGSQVNAAVVGKATFVRGLMTAQPASGDPRIVGSGESIGEHDVLRTGARSFAVLKLNDDSKITLRPNSVFKVDKFLNKQQTAGTGNVFLRLFKGGLRVVTGLVGKRNPSGYRLFSPNATIGIRGTDFEARLCTDDCKQEARKKRPGKGKSDRVAARVAFLRGKLNVASRTGSNRNLLLGGSLFEGDVLETAPRSIAVIVFQDESRFTLRPNSKMRIKEFKYNRKKPAESNAFVNFLRGSVRVVTGLIAKARPRQYRLSTPLATIGIRGTGFELRCLNECTTGDTSSVVSKSTNTAKLLDMLIPAAHAQAGSGMSAWVFKGSIEFQLPNGGLLTVNQGQAAYYDGVNPPKLFPTVPLFFQGLTQPKTDAAVEKSVTAEAEETQEVEAGLYVRVIEGDVIVTNEETQDTTYAGADQVVFSNPKTNEAVYISGTPRLSLTPDPKLFDDPKLQEVFQLLDGGSDEPDNQFECVVQ